MPMGSRAAMVRSCFLSYSTNENMPSRCLGASRPYSMYWRGGRVSPPFSPPPCSPPCSVRRTHRRDDDLAVRGGLEGVALFQALADEPVVVDLAIDGEGDALIGVGEGLGAAPCLSVRKTAC